MAVLGHTSGAGVPAGIPVPTLELELESIQPSPFQPRRKVPQTHIEALADSIRQFGVLDPICVRPLPGDLYQIIDGECRWRAAKLVGLTGIPCRVREATDDEALVLALIENLQREDLSPLEEALSYQQILDRGIVRNRAGIARLVGVSRARITQRMKILELDPITQQMLEEHRTVLTEYHGRILREVESLTDRRSLAERAVAGKWSGAKLREEVEEYHRLRDIAAWQQDGSGLPRSYSVSYAGFRLHLDMRRADVSLVTEALRRLVVRLEAAR